MSLGNMPAAEIEIDAQLVRGLLEAQHRDLADLELVEHSSGWDNVLFRLGDALVVRLPRRQMSAELVVHEQRWLPDLAPRLPLPIPVPVRAGRPGLGYPWAWSVTPWLPGEIAARTPPADPFTTAEQLGAFLAALHTPAPPDAPVNPFRGGPLADRAPAVHDRIDQLQDLIDGPATRRHFEILSALAVPEERTWIHGDLHPANVLVADGRLSAVIDFGDISAGDRATDCAAAWMFLPPGARPVFRAAAGGIDDDTWARAQGWAIALALAYLANSGDNPVMGRVGRDTLEAVLLELAN